MLDMKLIRENPYIVENDLKKRGDTEKKKTLFELIGMDKDRRGIIQQLQEMRHKRNIITREVAEMKSKGLDASKKLKEVHDLPEKIKSLEEKLEDMNNKCNYILMRLPNILHDTVPVGKDDNNNDTIRTHGAKINFDFKPKDHIDLGVELGLIDIERAAKISGSRFYFLKGELALAEMSLMRFAIDFMNKKGYKFVLPPYMMRREPYEGVTDLNDFGDVLYKIDGDDMHMIATSEHPLTAQYMNETLDGFELPIKMTGFSTNFRKEAGSHGKDTKGIFRVHQFNKVEQVIICKPGESWVFHEELIRNAEEFFKQLELPFRTVNVCTGDIGTVAAKKYDLEAWIPEQKKYREMVSCSNCTDYQARRLGIKYREDQGKAAEGFVHTLNSTVVTDRALVAIMENNQQKDGSIIMPKALQKYTGFDVIRKKS